MDQVLGPVPPREGLAVEAIREVYGSPRMQLASLPREVLDVAVKGLGCDFYEVGGGVRGGGVRRWR